jgi:DNA helicase-2/ATP-dependent DNA helicase PcrA
MLAVEQGILPHERSLSREDEVEEERRLAFVGMTRAKEELYLCHVRYRDFRGQTLYAVPSMFLAELPEGIEHIDQAARPYTASVAADYWRSGGKAAEAAWMDAGVTPRRESVPTPRDGEFVEGMLVQHEMYGVGRITELRGYGAMRKVKIRFQTVGEKTFIADKVKLVIVRGG